MLRVTTLKIRKLSFTRTFLQIYALLFMAQTVPVPQPTEILGDASTNISDSGGDDEEFQCHTESQSLQMFTQSELNDVIRDLGLSKERAELLGS
jgi:uncharacterized protein YpmS